VVGLKKVLVVFDTKFGNTEELARKIAEGIESTETAQCTIVGIEEAPKQDIASFDGVLFGAPIHAFRATRGIKNAIKKVAKKGLDGKAVAAFDTYQAESHEGKALGQMEDLIHKKASGAKLMTPGLTALVDGYEGPLNEAVPARALEFGKEFAEHLE
jgi:menaquinone-dependent protoporphyrinogen IX oxidase